ncbi:MAG: dihydrofolate synthase / folylpolyglutamate synthase [Solirubrobacterales bacterium]|jgi:dihydrofolate synthase/folylpolyglutamate synthase|nr:dihydrofolate synthase / folylpolyglutamate synthase [Solirubrobacterales bacterium]
MPQHRFASIHVVGTNGKSSVTEITAALLEAHGTSAGAYLSPHDERWRQRVRIGGAEIDPEAFGAAVERVAQAVEVVDRALDEGEAVTQFEADTATAFVALAAARVEVGVIEAGLGGRLDATNVIPSRVTVLTSVGLEHTEYLGDTEVEIATEKLAVLRDHTTLVIGPLAPEVEELARSVAGERHAEVVSVRDLSAAVELPVDAPYLRRNFAVALAAAQAVLGSLDVERVMAVAAGLELHGRMEVVEGDPVVVLDAAHNPAGAAALAEALPEVAGGRPVVACLALLADKDAAGVVGALAPFVAGVVATEIPAERLAEAGRPGARALAASRLAELAREAGIGRVEEVGEPAEAVRRARSVAQAQGGLALVAGSHYLLRYALSGA